MTRTGTHGAWKAMRRRALALALLRLVIVGSIVAGCPEQTAVWVDDGTPVSELVFHLGRTPGRSRAIRVDFLTISSCTQASGPNAIAWAIDRRTSALVDHIAYGVAPSGFVTARAAGELRPGCYYAEIQGEGSAF